MKNKNYFLFLVLMSLAFISCNQGNSQLSFKFDETRKAIIDKQEEIRYEKKEQEIEVEIRRQTSSL
ncbi:hypothetical protein DB313_04695 (plasmid) [Borrelia turcica IST7]|uniref:Uncharacterized protein n=1 Tax=Borrelia turcica IST7 TaxID=1104446 RepID=A0A386PPV1_9SPIR|nr:hypothetical protein [Borrelia turcica]AYE36800.1 hypothetical protein DB313_04695 [Borrelia turcica IST7]